MKQTRTRQITARELIDWQGELLRWWNTIEGKQFGDIFLSDEIEKSPGIYPPVAGWLAHQCKLALITASPYYVTREIEDIIMGTARLRDSVKYSLLEHDLITPSGFMVFEDQVYMKDGRGKYIGMRALSWRCASTESGQRAIHICAYTDTMALDLYQNDSYYKEMKERDGKELESLTRFLLVGHHTIPLGIDQGVNMEVDDEFLKTIKLGDDLLAQQQQGKVPMTSNIARKLKEQGVVFDQDIFLAAVLVMKQKIAGISGASVDRAAYRRSQRDGMTAPNLVNIVTLRKLIERGKIFPDEMEDSDMSWSHRWWVSGHWRYQYYPSRDIHEWIYIEPHIKGPEHLPVILKPDVYFLER